MRRLFFAIAALGLAAAAFAQQRSPEGQMVRPSLPKSPEILADGRVTFRLQAPEASKVLVRNTTGGWAVWPEGDDLAMTKDDKGVWSLTVGPLKPEFYTYTFVVNGVQALDPSNSLTSRDGSRYSSSLRMSGEKTGNYQSGDVPHGTVSLVWYPSPTLNLTRRAYIYTPAGYEKSGNTRYPVFYLLHGGGGDEDAWTTLGRAPEILDNLIAQGKAKPMIVVMTNGNAGQKASQDFLAPAAALRPEAGAAPSAQERLKFPVSLVKDVIPFVDSTYRTRTDRESRAIAGLSMGAGQVFYATFNNIDKFAWVGVFSAGWPTMPDISVPIPAPANADQLRGPDITRTIDPVKFLALLPQLDASANSKLRLLYVHIGAEDGLISAHGTVKDLLKSKGINATVIETHGYGHEWAFWRVALQDFAPRLFPAASK